jgi:hypothetical protein
MAMPNRDQNRVVAPRRLWFGLTTPAIAWVSLGIINIIIEWKMCWRHGQGAVPAGHSFGRGLSIVISIALLGLGIAAGVTSYRNWRKLSDERHLLHALGTERREFMALMALFVSVTLGMGMFWLMLTPFIITACERAK